MGVDEINTAPTPVVEKKIDAASTPASGSVHSDDIEKQVVASQQPDLQRRLKARHLSMIAIGGTIGTGLFIGSGGAIAKAGPVGALIAYIFVGTIVYSVMTSLGEMATYLPVSGAFTAYATRFIDPSLGFAMGWIYFLSWGFTYALELTATGLIVQYWNSSLSIGIFIGIFWFIITAINYLPVSFYGEVEFWMSTIKIVTVVGFLIFGICIDAGASPNGQGYLGFRYWSHPGAFAPYLLESTGALAKFVGFWACLIQAGFSYQGTELIGIAAGECENPRKNMPAAIRKTFWRILIFYVGSVFFIGLLVPYDNENLLSSNTDATSSPFVIAASLAGVDVLPGLINAVLLFVVLSAANSNVYSGSRVLVGLANEGSAPNFITRTTKSGVPYVAVTITAAFGLLAFLNLSANGGLVFNWFLNIIGVAGFITWACISGCHISFMRILKSRGISRDTLPYKAMWQPFFAWYGLFFNVLIIITQGFTAFIPWDTSSFFVAYVSVILFVLLYVGHKIVMRTSYVRKEQADIVTGCTELDQTAWSFQEPTTWYGKAWSLLMG